MKKKTILQPIVKSGFTLIESTLAAVVLIVVLTAIMTFRYQTVTSAERAENQLLAARSAYLLSEAWRGVKADTEFDPTQQDFENDFQIEKIPFSGLPGFGPTGTGSMTLPPGLTPLGDYRIRIDNKEFLAHLLYGPTPGVWNLRTIHVLIVWQDHRGVWDKYYLPTLSQT